MAPPATAAATVNIPLFVPVAGGGTVGEVADTVSTMRDKRSGALLRMRCFASTPERF
jgi:hypothetical protein